jgi:hypothetical protein
VTAPIAEIIGTLAAVLPRLLEEHAGDETAALRSFADYYAARRTARIEDRRHTIETNRAEVDAFLDQRRSAGR